MHQRLMSTTDNLANLKDDMVAFIEGHGMRRFPGFIDYDEVQRVVWKPGDNPESWKDFVELAKAAGAPFLTMDAWVLKREELETLMESLSDVEISNDEDLEDARWLRTYLGKTGFIQLGFAYQGIMMVYEVSTEWNERYQSLLEMAEEFGGIPIDGSGFDEET